MAATANGHYATLQDPSTLIIDQRTLALPVPITKSHEVAMADSGLVAIADYRGGAWFVRPGSDRVEAAPRHATSPLSVTARGNFVAWGYQDGGAVVVDTQSQQTWSFVGQSTAITTLVLDDHQRKLVTESRDEVRIWNLPAEERTITQMPCAPSLLTKTTDPANLAMACGSGSVWLWNPETGATAKLHDHADLLSGLKMYRDEVCSASWAGRVLCTSLYAPQQTHVRLEGAERIKSLAACPQGTCLIAAANDGKVWRLGETPEVLFSHSQAPTTLQISANGERLAAGALDGALVIYDLKASRLITRQPAHRGAITVIRWQGETLWTAGRDGTVKRWQVNAHDAASEEVDHTSGIVPAGLWLTPGARITATEAFEIDVTARDPGQSITLNVGEPILYLLSSEDQRFIVALSMQSTTVLDLQRRALAVIPMRDSNFRFAYFLTSDHLALGARDEIHTIDVTKLPFITY
jgi:WD40 repeat protein